MLGRYGVANILAAALIAVLGFAVSGQVVAASPVEAFGKLPNIRSVRLSPDGTHYAAMQPVKGRDALVVYDMYGTPGKNVKVMTFGGHASVEETLNGFFWANDNRIVARISFPSIRGSTRMAGGTDTVETRMISFDRNLKDGQQIPKSNRGARTKAGLYENRVAQIQDQIVSHLPNDPDHILIDLDREGKGWDNNVYKVNVEKGTLDKLVSGDSRIIRHMADQAGNVRLRFRYSRSSENREVDVRTIGDNDWHPVPELSQSTSGFHPLAFTSDPNVLFVSATGASGRRKLLTFNIQTKEIVEEVFSHPRVDFEYISLDQYTGNAVGFSYTDHAPETKYIDNQYMDVKSAVEKKLPGMSVRLVSRDTGGDKWIVRAEGAGKAPAYYLYMRLQRVLQEIARVYPSLTGVNLGAVKPFSYQARDGLSIPAYVTKPAGVGPYPVVVIPHGGPDARDDKSFDYLRQFLVSRGYLVFQPNFRGSSGYGRTFEKAGHHQWGLAMQDDVTDGVRALISQGVADPHRICIVGASYGGYAALMGAAKTPDLYQCAVSIAGISDIPKFLREKAQYKFSSDNDPRIGDKSDDSGRLRDTSPANNVNRIKAPILLLHGEYDRVVSLDHSKIMARKLKGAGKEHRFVVLEAGDHYLSLEKNRIRALEEIEAFLATHIGS